MSQNKIVEKTTAVFCPPHCLKLACSIPCGNIGFPWIGVWCVRRKEQPRLRRVSHQAISVSLYNTLCFSLLGREETGVQDRFQVPWMSVFTFQSSVTHCLCILMHASANIPVVQPEVRKLHSPFTAELGKRNVGPFPLPHESGVAHCQMLFLRLGLLLQGLSLAYTRPVPIP